jgi:hypothetical protein
MCIRKALDASFLRKCFSAATIIAIQLGVCFAADSSFPDCLNSSDRGARTGASMAIRCPVDPRHLLKDTTIGETLAMIDVDERADLFLGCVDEKFRTMRTGSGATLTVHVYYPDRDLSKEQYIGPLIHELGHVFQFQQMEVGTRGFPSGGESIERIELGADFLAGLVAGRLDLDPKMFVINPEISGTYNLSKDSHGRPEDRTNAFRLGYFYSEKKRSLADAYVDFQDNLFAQLRGDLARLE